MKRRHLTEGMKRRVAAAKGWTCSMCQCLLSAAFHIDHCTALWDGGEDTDVNLQALCGSCHASKTMNENIERARRTRVRKQKKAKKAHRRLQKEVQRTCRPNITRVSKGKSRCDGCGLIFYTMFDHTTCAEWERRIETYTKPAKRTTNPFEHFAYIG